MKGGLFERLRRSEYWVIMSLVLFVGMMIVVSVLVGSDAVLSHVAKLDLVVFVGLLSLSSFNYLARSYRWHLFSRHLKLDVPLGSNTLYYVAGFSMTTTPGKLGEGLRLWLMERSHRYGYQRVAPLFLGDRLSDMIAMLVLTLAGVSAFAGYQWITLVIALGIGLFALLFIRPRLLLKMVGMGHAATAMRWPRLFAKIRRTLRLTAQLFDLRVFILTLLLALSGWAAECYAFLWLLQTLGAPVEFLQAAFIFSFSMIAGAISMLPGGLGGVEAVMLGLLVGLGTDMDAAIAATAIIRLTTLWFAVGLGFLVLPTALRRAGTYPAGANG